ncbi:hypothetical protein [Chryseosolibacter indicus]|uniref:DoxX family protein n=1 Tax=Chryseosolibacter indicus TaxID=2782351 RepID=A0ABS5VWC3_9BACT|nr:hypothetical protein [Chryseosolibacter indicus]MBT1705179.1 hypothetical protein [Chryseosolibacter indicus]
MVLDATLLMILKLISLTFLVFTFTEAGLSKIKDYKGNKAYFIDHLKGGILSGSSVLLFHLIIVQEVLTALLAIAGLCTIPFGIEAVALISVIASAVVFLQLYLGQRIAGDYAGAAGIVPYLIMSFISLIIFSLQ